VLLPKPLRGALCLVADPGEELWRMSASRNSLEDAPGSLVSSREREWEGAAIC